MSENTWHKTNKNWKKINTFLFHNETMSDCTFLIKVGNTTVKIPAHKYVLGGYSPEFYNLFYLLKCDDDDVSEKDFIKFLEFVYTETTEINMNNVEVLIMLAVRYSVEIFKDFCGDFLLKNVNEENVWSLMDKYLVYNIPNLELECLKVINKNRLIFEDPLFYEISNNTLTTILKSEQLINFKAITIFKGVDKWSEVFCNKNNQEINSVNKRLALGEALKYVRFRAMTGEEFSSCTLNVANSILNPTEMVKIYQFICTNGQTNCSYLGERRDGGIQTCNFAEGKTITIAPPQISSLDYLRFNVDKPVQFHGFGILGRINLLTIQNPEKFRIILKNCNGTIINEDIVEIHHDGTDKVYELLFTKSTLLEANKPYFISLIQQKPRSFLKYTANIVHRTVNVEGINFYNIGRLIGIGITASILFKEQQ